MILQMRASKECMERKSGRPFGGIGWLINKNIETNIIFKSDRITTLKISKTKIKLLIIGVYLPSNGTDQLDSLINELAEIEAIVETHTDHEILLIGDFNCDIIRSNKHDRELIKTINKLKMHCLDHVFQQEINYTFKGRGSSWIDHIITRDNHKLNINKVKIVTDGNRGQEEFEFINKSDHTPVYIELTVPIDNIITETENRKENNIQPIYRKKSPNWENKDFRKKYTEYLNEEIIKNNIIEKLNNIQYENKVELDNLIENFYNSIRISIELSMNKETKNKKIVKHTKNKNWWNKKLNKYKEKIKRLILKNKKNGGRKDKYKNKIKKLKYKFRKEQRKIIAIKRENECLKLTNLEKNNKKQYWQEMKKIMKTKTRPEINIDEATKTFKDLFNTTINQSEENKIKNKNAQLKNIEIKNKITNIGTHKISLSVIEEIIKNLRNGKASGNSKIPNEAVKYSRNTKILVIVRGIIEKIINYGFIPKNFNK